MKFKKLHLLMGAVIACSAFSASAAKRYVPVTSVHQLVDGATYAVGAVHNQWECSELYFTLVEEEDGSKNVQALPRQFVGDNANTFAASQLWTIKAHPECSCGNQNAAHNIYSPNVVYSMGKGETDFIVQAALVNNVWVPRNGTTKLDLNAEANDKTAVEFVPIPPDENYNGDAELLFAIHCGYNTPSDDSPTFFGGLRAMNENGAFDRYSTNTLSDFSPHMDQNTAANKRYTTYYRLYIEVDTENLEPAARAKWSELAANAYYDWLYAINPLCGERYQAEFTSRFPTAVLDQMTNDNITTLLTAEADKLAAELDESTFFNRLIVNAFKEQDLAAVISNVGSTDGENHAIMTANDNNTLICQINATRNKWLLELDENDYVLFKHGATGLYIPVMPESDGAAYGALVPRDQAGPHQFNKTPANNTWIHTADVNINTGEKTHRHMHCNIGGNTFGNVVAADNSSTWDRSRWTIEGVTRASEQEKEFISHKSALLTEIDIYAAALAAYWTADEVAAAKAEIEPITFETFAEDPAAELTARLADLSAIADNFWGDADNKHVIFQFDRYSRYLGNTGSNLNAPNATSAATVWQLHRVAGPALHFYLYNPSANKYAAGLSLSDNNESTISVYGLARNSSANYYEIQCVNQSGWNFINKTNSDNDGLTWYLGPDGGNKLKAYTTSEELTAIRDGFEIVNEVPADKVSATHCVSKYDKSIVDAMTGPVDTYSIYTFFANKDTYPASALYMPTDGDYFRIRNSEQGAGTHNRVILKWNTPPTNSTLAHGIFETGDDFDYSNTVFLYHEGHLLCVDNQLYMINHPHKNEFLSYASSVNDNTPIQFTFISGYQELGTYQLLSHGDRLRGVHIHNDNGNLNMCGSSSNNPPNTTTSPRNEPAHNVELEQVTAIPVAIHSDGFGSIVTPAYVVAPSEESSENGAVAFVAQIDGGKLKFVEIPAGHLITPNTHILIKGTSETVNLETVAIPTDKHTISEHTCSDVKLEVAYGRKLITPEKDEVIYVKSERPTIIAAGNAVRRRIDTTGATFNLIKLQPNEDGQVEIPGGAMTVRLTSDNEKPEELAVPLSDGIPTEIEEISYDEIPAAAAEGIYDLQGRRLAAPVKGINIINGHKTFIR